MHGLRARLALGGMALVGALVLAAPSATLAFASSRVDSGSTSVGALKVRVYSQMCDGFGSKLHTRLNVKNTASVPKNVLVQDPFAKVVYDPPGPIKPGQGTLVHLTSPRKTPAHSVTVVSDGVRESVAVAESPPGCTPSTDSSSSSSSSTSTTSTTKTTGPTSPPYVPGGGGPVVGPGVVAGTGGGSSGTPVKAAAKGTLPFTGSDIRAFALLGDLMVLIGFAMLIISHRSPRMALFLKRLSPKRLSPSQAP